MDSLQVEKIVIRDVHTDTEIQASISKEIVYCMSLVTFDSFWYPKELSYMKALGKVVAVNPWKVWEECTARRKRVTGCLIQQTTHWQFNS